MGCLAGALLQPVGLIHRRFGFYFWRGAADEEGDAPGRGRKAGWHAAPGGKIISELSPRSPVIEAHADRALSSS